MDQNISDTIRKVSLSARLAAHHMMCMLALLLFLCLSKTTGLHTMMFDIQIRYDCDCADLANNTAMLPRVNLTQTAADRILLSKQPAG